MVGLRSGPLRPRDGGSVCLRPLVRDIGSSTMPRLKGRDSVGWLWSHGKKSRFLWIGAVLSTAKWSQLFVETYEPPTVFHDYLLEDRVTRVQITEVAGC